MSSQTELKRSNEKEYRMDENWLWYLVGAFDTAGSITMKIKVREKAALGYEFTPLIMFSRPSEENPIFGMVDEYAQEHGVNLRKVHPSKTNCQLKTSKPDEVRRFLEPLSEGLIQQHERAEIMLNEILPMYEDGRPGDKESVLQLMEAVDRLKEKPVKSRRQSKYNLEHFEDEWNMSLSQ